MGHLWLQLLPCWRCLRGSGVDLFWGVVLAMVMCFKIRSFLGQLIGVFMGCCGVGEMVLEKIGESIKWDSWGWRWVWSKNQRI